MAAFLLGKRSDRIMARGKAILKESYCINHGRMLPMGDFYDSKHKFHPNKVMPYCKDCCNEMFKYYLKNYKTLQSALYFTCAHMGVPFIKKVYEAFEQEINSYKNPQQYFGIYLRLMNTYGTKDEKEKWDDFAYTDVDYKDMNTVQEAEKALEIQESELKAMWGYDKSLDELAYLEQRFEIYTKNKELEPYQEGLYKNLCCADLMVFQGEDIEQGMKIQRQCAKDLGLDQFDKQQYKSIGEEILENHIALIENEEPAEYYRDKKLYKDFRGIHAGWIQTMMRPMINLITGSKEYNLDKDQANDYLERTAEDGKDSTR